MSNDYQQGFLDGCLLTEDIVMKELARNCSKKESKERLANEFKLIKEKVLTDRISGIRRQLDII